MFFMLPFHRFGLFLSVAAVMSTAALQEWRPGYLANVGVTH